MFPAYSAQNDPGEGKSEATSLDWLANSSFVVPVNLLTSNDEKDKKNNLEDENEKKSYLEKYFSDSSDANDLDADSVRYYEAPKKSSEKLFLGSNEEIKEKTSRSDKKKGKNKRKKSKDRPRSEHDKKQKRKTYPSDNSGSEHDKKKKRKTYPSDNSGSEHDKKLHKHKKKKKKDERGKSDKREKKKEEVRAKDDFLSLLVKRPNKVFIEDVPSLAPEDAFRIDRRKDDNNLAYGSIFSEHIAKRYRITNCAIGALKGKPVWLSDKKLDKKNEYLRYYFKDFIRLSKKRGQKCGNSSAKLVSEEYVPIIQHSENVSQSSSDMAKLVNPLGIYDSGTELWLQGKGKELDKGEKEITLVDDNEYETRLKMGDYNKQLNDNPHDIDLWLEFAEFQGKETNFTNVERDIEDVDKNKPLRASLIEIKMAVLHKALEKNPSCLKLKLAQLEYGKDLWDTDDLLKEWNKLLFQHANNGLLWVKYLEFRQSWSIRFSISSVMKAFEKSIKTLDGISKGEIKSHPVLAQTEYYLLYIFSEACRVLCEAGHQEKATAMYQAMIEYNLFFPDVLKEASANDVKDFFEAFWEGMTPRIGEDNAHGWKIWVESKGSGNSLTQWSNREHEEQLEENILKTATNTSEAWFNIETTRNLYHWLPWRPDVNSGETDDDCDDPDRQVLSDDVTSCIFKLNTEKEKFLLLCQFLQFLGVNIKSVFTTMHETNHISWSDRVFSNAACLRHNLLQKTCSDFENFDKVEKFVCNLFEQVTPQFGSLYKRLLNRAYIDFKVKKMQRNNHSSKEYKGMKKWIKSLLKLEENRNCLLLWEALANFEWIFGSKTDAIKVIGITLSTAKCGSVQDKLMQNDVCRLYRRSVELLLGVYSMEGDTIFRELNNIPSNGLSESDKNYVMNVLYSLVSGEEFPIIQDKQITKVLPLSKTMKGKRLFTEHLNNLVDQFNSDELSTSEEEIIMFEYTGSLLINWTICTAFYIYLSETFEAVVEFYKSILERLKPKTKLNFGLEEGLNPRYQCNYQQYKALYETYLKLCKYHVDITPVAPMKLLRDPLYMALDDLPRNCSFLDMYVDIESNGSIAGKVRQFFRQLAQETGNSIVWLFAILAELTRKLKIEEYEVQNQLYSAGCVTVKETGITHQMRAWFERAVSHPVARQSVLLWRLYALFEAEQQCIAQAKAVFYRALQQCPGAKAIYMDMAKYLPDHLSEVTDLMTEKELRLRTPLEELQLLLGETDTVMKIEESKPLRDVNTDNDDQD